MEAAFPDAMVADYGRFMSSCGDLPDPDDKHVLSAALKAQASMIVTDNLRHFPERILRPLNVEARTTDQFLADTVALDAGRAVVAFRRMRERLKRPEKSVDALLIDMEASGLLETVDVLRPYASSL